MKDAKLAALLIFVFMLTAMIFSCYAEKPVSESTTDSDISTAGEEKTEIPVSDETSNGQTEDEESTEETSAYEPTDITDINEDDHYNKLARDILESIKNGDYIRVAEYMGLREANSEPYRFIQDITVESYEIVEAADEDYDKYFKIKFNISKSDGKYFPAGESYWDLVVSNGMEIVRLFKPSDADNKNYIRYEHENSAESEYKFCYYFSHHLNIFETATDFNTVIVISDDAWGGTVHSILHYYGATAPERLYPLPADAVDGHMVKTTGITGIDYTLSGRYGKEDISGICEAHGGSWRFWRPVSKEYDENAEIYTVVLDYFADTSLLVVAKTIKYRFTPNGDGTYKMLSLEVLYDSGYSICGGSI